MKKVLSTAILIATVATMNASAQICSSFKLLGKDGNRKIVPIPQRSLKHHKVSIVNVTYDAASTVLTVTFPSNSQGGSVEVFRNGTKVAGVTANSGTTFSCRLREYGTGNYNVIVSRGNTVIDSKNYTVK